MARKGGHVTLSDIAKKLGVSKVTVSKALRGHPDISSETSRKVTRLAHEMDYFPNRIARSLSSKKSNIVGVIIPKIAHHFFAAVMDGIHNAAFEQGYEILLTVSQESAARELRHVQSLVSLRVDGLIVSLSQESREFGVYHRVREMGVPVVFMDRVLDDKHYSRVVADDFGGARLATEHAIALGYTKLAHIGGFQHSHIGRERYRGFEVAMTTHGLPIRRDWVVLGGFGEEDGYQGFRKIVHTKEMPQFIFAATFPIALGVYRAAEELGIRIPADFDIICFGRSGMQQLLSPSITYIEQPTTELGAKALELILTQIRKPDNYVPELVTLPTRLVICKTCVSRPTVSPPVESGHERPTN